MTVQTQERLHYKGEELEISGEPLAQYFSLSGDEPDFQVTSSACWRGYVGHWEVIDDRLYLIGIEGRLKSGEEVRLEVIFPGCKERVFASWFDGSFSIPQGEPVDYIFGDIAVYESELLLTFERGRLVHSQPRQH